MGVEDDFEGVLLELESAVISVYGANSKLLDKQVLMAIDVLYRYYERQKKGQKAFAPSLPGISGQVYSKVFNVCETWVGNKEGADSVEYESITITELLRCLKRIQKSIKMWSKKDGKQGYLDYGR